MPTSNVLTDKMPLFQFAQNGKLFLVTLETGDEVGWVRGPTTKDGMPREPKIGFYEKSCLLEDIEIAFDDGLDEILLKENIITEEQPTSLLLDEVKHFMDKQERWWHQLPRFLQYFILNYTSWNNGKPIPEWFGPRPQCCEVKDVVKSDSRFEYYPWVALYLRHADEEQAPIQAQWYCGSKPVKYCPLCGTKLPEVEKDPHPIGPIHHSSDGNYCDTCGSRNHACSCRVPWAAYRLKSV